MAGLNCVCGPVHMAELMLRLPETDKPLMALPNAGYPVAGRGGGHFSRTTPRTLGKSWRSFRRRARWWWAAAAGPRPEHIRRTLACMAQAKPVRIQGVPAPRRAQKGTADASVFDGAWTKKRVAVELDPPMDADFAPLLEGARAVQAAGADLLTIADSPLARTRANSILSAAIVRRETGMEVLPHLSCRDKNHIAIKGELLGACYEGIRQVLAVTGDPIMQEVFARRAAVFNFNSYELISFIQSLNGDVFRDSPFAVGGALNVNAPKFENELKRACKKEACGASFFLTQPIYTEQALDNLARARQALRGKIMAGFMPVASYKNALFLNHEVSGVEIPPGDCKAAGGHQPAAGVGHHGAVCSGADEAGGPALRRVLPDDAAEKDGAGGAFDAGGAGMTALRPALKEVLRYLGHHGQAMTEEFLAMAERCIDQVCRTAVPRHCAGSFLLERTEAGLKVGGTTLTLTGRDIARLLQNSRRCILLAATLGPEVDALIRQRQAQSMAEAVLCDAAATALIECVCDEAEKQLWAGLARGERLTRRYSCGYGDLPLSLQPDFVRVLDTPRKIGLACTPSLLLTPQKSVTAVLGIAKAPAPTQAGALRNVRVCRFMPAEKGRTHCGR